ncbi:unnamed protein product [Rotaria magnacalcarata]|uniref:Uncharacterized protein n=2 Tax=Rotaria magnacalcarata TaxID=392030 RepID=A0A8S2ND40_9BILA|nr:unnamed protein product [Rotaria magnacalcarata]CAF4021421.1 unnamed protein product [Rotaria magnacalcarata]
MKANHLLPLYSSTEVNDSESDSSTGSDDDVIENVIRMLDDVMTMTDVTKELQDDEEDDGQQQAHIHIPTTSVVVATTNPIYSKNILLLKICHKELGQQLIKWFTLKRTNPNNENSTAPTEIKKERMIVKNSVRHGKKICLSLKIQPYPSKVWFCRFLKRHNLSLPKPKRQQKIMLSEPHNRDICNMDESPLALFGDQSKASINYVNTPNEVEGNLNDKRFCTLVLSVFADDNSRLGPALIFKGKRRASEQEKNQYDKSVKVYFSPTAFINSSIMKNYTKNWLNKKRDGRPKMFITDSCSGYFSEDVNALFKKIV